MSFIPGQNIAFSASLPEKIQPDLSIPGNSLLWIYTSSLSIQDIAFVTKRKDRFGGLQVFNSVRHETFRGYPYT
jgi:hypothetical protein